MPTQQEEGMINKIIKDWVGKDCPETPYKAFSDGYNVCLQDLKSRIPQLTERIVEIIESHRDRDLPEEEKHQCNVLINDILKDLK